LRGTLVRQFRFGHDAMNWSMFTADRATHFKIAVVALASVLLIAAGGIFR